MTRLRTPDWLAGLSGAVLLAGLLIHGKGGPGTVWLAIAGLLGVGVAVVTATRDAPALPVAFDVLSTWAALISLPVVLVRVLGADERPLGLWLTACAVVALFAASWWAMRKQDQPGMRPAPEPRAMPAP